ncbi:MAG TPA: SDR family oxidoreductase [Rhizomicrobium sp.]|jgi:nucleoside-diphosphate-sugar epimerase|nr:SDR family oxidoreductase [Rhizomicrobium sp.]
MLFDVVAIISGFVLGTAAIAGGLLRYDVFLGRLDVWHLAPILLWIVIVLGLNFALGVYTSVRAKPLWLKTAMLMVASTAAPAAVLAVLAFGGHLAAHYAEIVAAIWVISSIVMIMGRVIRERIRQEVAEEFTIHLTKERENCILVIGGGGYIGSALVPKLLNVGYKVIVLDKLYFGDASIAGFMDHPNVEIFRHDFRDVEALVRLIRRAGAIVHLGGLVGDPACAVDPELTIDINVTSTRLIGEIARANGIRRFIFASSCSVYGASNEIVDERSAFNPQSLYAQSKVASEAVLAELCNGQFAPTYLRFATIYGLSGRTRFDLVVNLLSAKAARGEDITVFGGDQWRPFVHVDDVAEAVFLTLRAPIADVANRSFNVGSNEQNMTLLDVGEHIRAIVPGSRIVETNENVDRRNYRVNFDRIRTTLGFTPRWTIEAGIHQVVDAIKSGHVGDYKASSHSNVQVLRELGSQVFLQRYNHGWETAYLDRRDPIQETGEIADPVTQTNTPPKIIAAQ